MLKGLYNPAKNSTPLIYSCTIILFNMGFPIEVQEMIFKRLQDDDPYSFWRYSLVCKLWNEQLIALDEVLFKPKVCPKQSDTSAIDEKTTFLRTYSTPRLLGFWFNQWVLVHATRRNMMRGIKTQSELKKPIENFPEDYSNIIYCGLGDSLFETDPVTSPTAFTFTAGHHKAGVIDIKAKEIEYLSQHCDFGRTIWRRYDIGDLDSALEWHIYSTAWDGRMVLGAEEHKTRYFVVVDAQAQLICWHTVERTKSDQCTASFVLGDEYVAIANTEHIILASTTESNDVSDYPIPLPSLDSVWLTSALGIGLRGRFVLGLDIASLVETGACEWTVLYAHPRSVNWVRPHLDSQNNRYLWLPFKGDLYRKAALLVIDLLKWTSTVYRYSEECHWVMDDTARVVAVPSARLAALVKGSSSPETRPCVVGRYPVNLLSLTSKRKPSSWWRRSSYGYGSVSYIGTINWQ